MGVCQSRNVYRKLQYIIARKPLQVKWKITQIHLHFSHFQLWIWRCCDPTTKVSSLALPQGETCPHPVKQRGIFLMLNAPLRQEPGSPQSLSRGIDIGSVLVLHPLLYSSDSPVSFSPLHLSHVTLPSQHPHPMSVMLVMWLFFKTSQFSWGCLFVGRNWWSTTPVFYPSLRRETSQW